MDLPLFSDRENNSAINAEGGATPSVSGQEIKQRNISNVQFAI